MKIKKTLMLAAMLLPLAIASSVNASAIKQTKGNYEDKFRQLDETLPTPNVYRNASGEPGENYWQQQVDYKIKVSLDEQKRRLSGSEKITYKNNSPYKLKYLWVQLDQNVFKEDSIGSMTKTFNGDSPAAFSTTTVRVGGADLQPGRAGIPTHNHTGGRVGPAARTDQGDRRRKLTVDDSEWRPFCYKEDRWR